MRKGNFYRKRTKKTGIKGKQLEYFIENIFEKYNSLYSGKFKGIRLETPFISPGGTPIRTGNQPSDYLVVTREKDMFFDAKECESKFFYLKDKNGNYRDSLRNQATEMLGLREMGKEVGFLIWFKGECSNIDLACYHESIRFISNISKRRVSVNDGIPFTLNFFDWFLK